MSVSMGRMCGDTSDRSCEPGTGACWSNLRLQSDATVLTVNNPLAFVPVIITAAVTAVVQWAHRKTAWNSKTRTSIKLKMQMQCH